MRSLTEHEFLFTLAECIKNNYLRFDIIDGEVKVTIDYKYFKYKQPSAHTHKEIESS